MTTGTDQFEELEAKIIRTIELVKTTRQELAAARAENKVLQRELDQLRRERDLVKNKVESLLETLSELTEETVV
jgi:regulator of replication initiation timing